MSQKLIGISTDWEATGSFADAPYIAVRENYIRAISNAGGIPILIPQEKHCISKYLTMIDGLLLTGGGYAFPSSWYVQEDEQPPYASTPRAEFDIALAKAALERNIPILGICAGMQILAGVSGCKLTRNVHRYYQTKHDHLKGNPASRYDHMIDIVQESLLHQVLGTTTMQVNSHHCEGVVSFPERGVMMSAKSPDGVIEALELPEQLFVIGVQWHPEYFQDTGSKLFKGLVEAS